MSYQEYKDNLNSQLYKKIQNELSTFKEEVLQKSPRDILDMAYPIVIKNDIAVCFENTDYPPAVAKALLKSPNLLHEIYTEWLDNDLSHMNDLKQTISDFKNYMVKTEKILNKKEKEQSL
jgi:hypothetical protein